MLRKALLLTAALSLIIGSTPNAGGADLCFRYKKSGGGTLVARGAQLPARDTCHSLALFESGGQGGHANGMICRDNVESTTIRFHYTYDGCLGGPTWFESGTCYIQLTANNGFVSSSCRFSGNSRTQTWATARFRPTSSRDRSEPWPTRI